MAVTPYLFIDGRCDEAIEFYKKNLGAEVEMLMRYKDSPDRAPMPPGADDKVLHACFRVGDLGGTGLDLAHVRLLSAALRPGVFGMDGL